MLRRRKKMISMGLTAAMLASLSPVWAEGVTMEGITSGTEDVSIISDVSLEFSQEPNAADITITPAVEFEAVKDGNNVTLEFAEELSYNTEYTISFGADTAKFQTERNPITTLFFEDFEGDAETAKSRFVEFNTNMLNEGAGFSVANGALNVTQASAFPLKSDGKENGDGMWWGSKPIIANAENWIDYEIQFDYRGAYNADSAIVYQRVKMYEDGIPRFYVGKQNISGKMSYLMSVNSANYSHPGTTQPLIGGYAGAECILEQSEYNVTFSAVGTELKLVVNQNGTKISEVSKNVTSDTAMTTRRGAPGFSAYTKGTTNIYDNILITDKGFYFDVLERKNIGDTITLEFNDTISNFDEGKISIAPAVDFTAENNGKFVTITADFARDTEYTVTVDQTLANSAGSAMSNDKIFTVKTADKMPASLVASSVANGASNVSVLSDIELEFSEDLDFTTIGKLTVTGTDVSYELDGNGRYVDVIFADALPYNTEISISTAGLKTQSGADVNAELKFTTERNPITTLFFEDFNGDAQTAKARFEEFDTGKNTGSDFKVEDGALKVTQDSTVSGNATWRGSKPVVKGAENWIDYEMQFDYKGAYGLDAATVIQRAKIYDDGIPIYYETKQNVTSNATWLRSCNQNTFTVNMNLINANVNVGGTNEKTLESAPYSVKYSLVGTVVSSTVTQNGEEITTKTHNITNDKAVTTRRGAPGFTVYPKGQTNIYDNILITDKGFYFEPQELKNIAKSITLEFNDEISNFDASLVTVKEHGTDNIVDATVTGNGKFITITSNNFARLTKYDVTVDQTLANSAGSAMSNDKTFTFKTSADLPTEVIASTIANGAKDISVLSDIELTFNEELNESTITNENITVSGYEGKFRLVTNEDKVKVLFEDEFAYNTEITVAIGEGVKNIKGIAAKASEIKFTTERNPITTLFFEDFSSSDAADRFEEFNVGHVTAVPEDATVDYWMGGYSVENGMLKLKKDSAKYASNGYYQGPKPIVKGAQNWIDYEVEYDTDAISGGMVILRANTSDEDYKEGYYIGRAMHYTSTPPAFLQAVISGATTEHNFNGSYLAQNKHQIFGQDVTSGYTTTDPLHVKMSAVGENVSIEVSQNGEVKVEGSVKQTMAARKSKRGAPGFAQYSQTATYFDNMLVTDKGFLFEVGDMKGNNGTFTLNFNADLQDADYNSLVTVKNGDTEVSVTVTKVNAKTLSVTINNPEDGVIYDVTVGQEIARLSDAQTMSNDKTFKVSVSLDYAIKGLDFAGTITSKGKIKAVAEIMNKTAEAKDFTLIIVVYNAKGAMVDTKTVTKSVLSYQAVDFETAEITLPEDASGYSASAFVWDTLEDMHPLADPKTI